MSAIDEIIARSRTPGTFIERRHFTLSREKAIEKLREFSLRHQQQYVLELIQAAVFAGATYIAVDITQTRLLVAWVGGRPYQASELESIFDYLFADRGELSTRHLTQLAIGLNALLQRKPRLIRIESGDGSPGTTARMDLNRSGEGQLGIPEASLAGTYLLVEYPSGWLPRLSQRQFFPEEGLIETRCLYVPVPVLLNGRAPFGYRASREIHLYGIDHQSRFDDGHRRGVIGLPGQEMGRAGRVSREFRMVVGGVWISTLELPELGGPPQGDGSFGAISGVICDDRLRKTADQSDIVQDRRFVELLHAVQPIATELIRENTRRGYVPPALPHIPDAAGSDEDSSAEAPAEPLPDILQQVGQRPGLSLGTLHALPPGEPLFWVRPDDADDLETALDPLRFGPYVLRLTPGQARSLSLELPGASITQLNNAADAEFVRRMLERRQLSRLHTVPFTVPDRPDVRGRLVLRFHAAGAPPRWGDPTDGDTPFLVTAGEETLWTGREVLGLRCVSGVLELEESLSDPQTLRSEIVDQAAQEAWRLLFAEQVEGDTLPDPGTEAELLLGLLALHTHPYFVAEAGQPLRVEVALPPQWGETADAVRTRDLAFTAASEPLSLDAVVALLQQGETRMLTSDDARRRLEGLEERLGFGHLLAPGDEAHPVLAVRYLEAQWQPLHPRRPQPPGPTLWVRPSLDPQPPPHLHAALGQHTNTNADAAISDALWAQGRAVLLEILREHEERNTWTSLAATAGHSVGRCQAMGRLAMLALALEGGGEVRVLRSNDGRLVAPRTLLAPDSPLQVAPRHGPSTLEPGTLPLTFDQLRLLSTAGQAPRLRLDDAPTVWRSLADAEDPRWLVRQEVRAPGLRGWLGLRIPFDPTAGILVQSLGAVAAMPHGPAQAPCHGLLWLSGGTVQLSRAQQELLTLARRQLYQRLSDAQDGLEGEVRAAAAAYLAAHAAERAPAPTAIAASVAGRPLLYLRERIVAALPPHLSESMHLTLADDPHARRGRPLRAMTDDVRGGLSFLLNAEHPLIDAALRDPRAPAAELLLLELVRLIAVWSQGHSQPADLLEMQRVLIAQRVSRVPDPPTQFAVPGVTVASRR